MLHLDIPTPDQVRRLAETRADACVSCYLPSTPLSQQAGTGRVVLGNLLREADAQLTAAGFDKRRHAMLREHIQELIDDDGDFWRLQAHSLAVFATPDRIQTFRLPNALRPMVEVSGRFHLKPLLRAITFPQAAHVLALSESAVRLVAVFPEGPPVEVKVPGMPEDAASAAGKSTIDDRSPSGRIQGSEGKKIRLAQYARKVDAALRPVLAGQPMPLFLAAAEPLAAIFHGVSHAVDLVPGSIAGSPDRVPDAELAAAARQRLDQLHAASVQDFHTLFEARAAERRATTDLSTAAKAAAFGAIEQLAVDIDAVVSGTFDEATGAITLDGAASAENYGVIDAVALRALATGARVLAVRKADIPGGAQLAATLRYAF